MLISAIEHGVRTKTIFPRSPLPKHSPLLPSFLSFSFDTFAFIQYHSFHSASLHSSLLLPHLSLCLFTLCLPSFDSLPFFFLFLSLLFILCLSPAPSSFAPLVFSCCSASPAFTFRVTPAPSHLPLSSCLSLILFRNSVCVACPAV